MVLALGEVPGARNCSCRVMLSVVVLSPSGRFLRVGLGVVVFQTWTSGASLSSGLSVVVFQGPLKSLLVSTTRVVVGVCDTVVIGRPVVSGAARGKADGVSSMWKVTK